MAQDFKSLNFGAHDTLEDALNNLSASIDSNTSSLATNTSLDNYSTFVTRDSNGNITQIQIKDGSSIIQTTNITRDSNGNVTSVSESLMGKTVTTTINRASDGTVASTSKAVV